MAPIRNRLAALALPLILLAAPGAHAGDPDVSGRDARLIRQVVEAQLEAMARSDDSGAFSLATPAVRTQFGTAANFMEMVRAQYPMLIRASETFFFRPLPGEAGVMQPVRLRDEDGNPWRALYHLQQQPDKGWRIDGCVVEPDEGKVQS